MPSAPSACGLLKIGNQPGCSRPADLSNLANQPFYLVVREAVEKKVTDNQVVRSAARKLNPSVTL
jgi:hypothetical protein